jgi:hypothetical protein
MTTPARLASTQFRVWLTRCREAAGSAGLDPALGAVAIEPAEEGTMSGPEARAYVATFNRVAALKPSRIRAVAVPIRITYEGEPRPGQTLGSVGAKKTTPSE